MRFDGCEIFQEINIFHAVLTPSPDGQPKYPGRLSRSARMSGHMRKGSSRWGEILIINEGRKMVYQYRVVRSAKGLGKHGK